MGFNTIFSFEWILGGEQLLLLAFLVFLEIALSIDNFAGMREALAGLPGARKRAIRSAASLSGLMLRIAMICIFLELTLLLDPFVHKYFSVYGISTGKAMFLTVGGAFLILKAITDLRAHLSPEEKRPRKVAQISALAIWLQLAYIDLLLSLDSVIAALSMVNSVKLIIVAMVVAHLTLHLNRERLDSFFARRSSMMTLTLAFILLLGVVSLFRGLGALLAEETLLAALLFGLLLEALNFKEKHANVREGAKGRKASIEQAHNDLAQGVSGGATGATTFEETAYCPHCAVTSQEGDGATIPLTGATMETPSRSATTPQSSTPELPPTAPSGVRLHAAHELFREETCSHCQTPTHGIFPFCLTCGQTRATSQNTFEATQFSFRVPELTEPA